MRRDIDFKLILLVVLVVGAIIGITLFYNYAATGVVGKYNDLKDLYESTSNNLSRTTTALNECNNDLSGANEELNETIVFHEESQDDFNSIFQETETELETTQSDLETTKSDLEEALLELEEVTEDLEIADHNLEVAEDRLYDFETIASKVASKGEDVDDDLDDCIDSGDIASCIDNVEDEYGELYGYIRDLDEI